MKKCNRLWSLVHHFLTPNFTAPFLPRPSPYNKWPVSQCTWPVLKDNGANPELTLVIALSNMSAFECRLVQ